MLSLGTYVTKGNYIAKAVRYKVNGLEIYLLGAVNTQPNIWTLVAWTSDGTETVNPAYSLDKKIEGEVK